MSYTVDELAAIAEQCTCHTFKTVAKAVTRVFDEHLIQNNIRTPQFQIILCIEMHGKCTMTKLAETTGHDRTTLTRLKAPLIRDGLIIEIPSDDKRKKVLEVTALGKNVLDNSIPLWSKAQEQIVFCLDGLVGTNATLNLTKLRDVKYQTVVL